jgi:hypothetical protein
MPSSADVGPLPGVRRLFRRDVGAGDTGWPIPGQVPLIARGTLVGVFPALRTPTAAQTITVTDDWVGMGNPYESEYVLERAGIDFVGKGRFRTTMDQRTMDVDVQVPVASADAFLRSLARLPVADGQYVPFSDHTDDFPSVVFAIQFESGEVRIFTESQGTAHGPWAVEFNGDRLVIDSPAPWKAYRRILRFLRRDEFEKMLWEARPQIDPDLGSV